jgi:hypothetical protein
LVPSSAFGRTSRGGEQAATDGQPEQEEHRRIVRNACSRPESGFPRPTPSGAWYQIEVEAFWDGRRDKNLRVLASIDDGGWSAIHPITDSFIIAPGGTFVGE